MKIIIKAFGVFEREYDFPMEKEQKKIYFIHKFEPMFSYSGEPMYITQVSFTHKAVFEFTRKYKDRLPIYEFKELE